MLFVKKSNSACKQRPDWIPGGAVVPLRCLSWWPHVLRAGDRRQDGPRVWLLFPLSKWVLNVIQQRLNVWKIAFWYEDIFYCECSDSLTFTNALPLNEMCQSVYWKHFFQCKGLLSLILPWIGFDYVWESVIRQSVTAGGNLGEIKTWQLHPSAKKTCYYYGRKK